MLLIASAAAVAAALAGLIGLALGRLARSPDRRDRAVRSDPADPADSSAVDAISAASATDGVDVIAEGDAALLARIEDCLPRTQCGQCDYPGCRPYAEAILADEAGIDRCPPGGARTVAALAALLDRPLVPIVAEPPPALAGIDGAALARIVEADCIGCALCLPACPTDAIVGAHRLMHTVIAEDCTGCALCVAPCPVDCIVMVASVTSLSERRTSREDLRT